MGDVTRRLMWQAALACAAIGGTTPALLAHEGHAHAHGSGFSSGIAHPISGLDHVLAMVAVGVWAAQLGGRAVWALPLVFAGVMALGGLVGIVGAGLPGVEIGIAASALVLGTVILAGRQAPLWVGCAVVAILAVFHGYAHGAEMAVGASAAAYSAGFVIATLLLHGAGLGLGLAGLAGRAERWLRAAGGLIGAAGVWMLAGAFGA